MSTLLSDNSGPIIELHQYLRQLVSPDQEAIRGEPDFARVEAYWHIGRIIVETEQQGQGRADYGVHLVEQLSVDLTQHYGKGYKTSNLWWFKQFYLAFPILHAVRGELVDIRQQLRTELTWTHYRLLIAIDNQQERHFYLHNAADEKWSYRTLNKLIKSRYYYQVALNEDQLLAMNGQQRKVGSAQTRRSRTAQARQILLSKPGWALVERSASGLPMSHLKPDVLFYQYHRQQFVGLWVGEPVAALTETIRSQLTEWQSEQPKTIVLSPLALLLTQKNELKPIVAVTSLLPAPGLSDLPSRI